MTTADERFTIKRDDVDATGSPTDGGFVVHQGSVGRASLADSLKNSIGPAREELLATGDLVVEDSRLVFAQDCTFTSPSRAGAMVLGTTCNGWKDWKLADGRTLSQVKRVSRPAGDAMLAPAKREEIQTRAAGLLNDGKLFTNTQLDGYYQTFRERFGPDALLGLDGEALLEFMHDHGNRDSLVYWLEFKHDDEFDTRKFGSIAGGSALKFRVFRRKETGLWQAGGESRNRPQDISVEEAVEIARNHRDQLIAGFKLLEELPDEPSDDDYALLQDEMDEQAPDVSKLAWGHKYFSLMFPEKLDDFHSPEWQRFHIMKLLQHPPVREGRYVCAGRFVAAAKEADLRMYQLTATLNAIHGRLHRYWRISIRERDNKVSHWEMMRERRCVAIGWKELGDLSWVEAKAGSRKRLKELLTEKHPDTHAVQVGGDSSKITNFVTNILEGDIVLAADGSMIVGIGKVVGEYRYEPEFDFPHQRPVEWLNLDEWKLPNSKGLRSTARELRNSSENIVAVESLIQNTASPVGPDLPGGTGHDMRLTGIPGRIQSVLGRKGQVILYGPPGTGKTFHGERTARDLAAISAFGKRYDRLDESQQHEIIGNDDSPGLVRLCCFHPAYGYEDFLEGYRPHTIDGQVAFELRDGVFKRMCRDAKQTPDRNFHLVIDEINRGDIPRIFGELLTTLEKDKRSKPIVLPVSQEPFTVPRNLFVIGTMNTADRSISLLDAALRRRFGFIELMPDGSVLRDTSISGIPIRAWFDALNERIRQHVGRDARNLQIGHSYLMQSGNPIKEIGPLKRAIRDDIIPLLEEYCYEDYGTLQSILGDTLVDADTQRIRHELFDDGQEEALVAALLDPFDDIATSTEALASDENTIEDESDGDDDDGVDDE